MQKQLWQLKTRPEQTQIDELKEQINASEALAIMLLQRGVSNFEEAKQFFNPTLEQIHDPMLMKDMDLALARLVKAVENEEKIMVYGDYDVDGTTSVSLFYSFLSNYYGNLEYYIPDRYKEGYGVSTRGIDYAHQQGVNLIISLDCGIKAHEKIEYCNSLGMDFIVCDHHTTPKVLPPAVAILDQKRPDCNYPYKELTGCGVGFKLLHAFVIHYAIPIEELWAYMDFLAISVACDIVPITGENRVFSHFGLKILNSEPRVGFSAMIQVAAMAERKLNVTDLVFGIGPRINAAGRIAHANHAVELMLSQEPEQAHQFALGVNQKNETRRDYDSAMTEEALEMIEKEGFADRKSTLLYRADWHKGVVGITASRCIEHYYRPTIILTESNGIATGSARSVKDFNVYDAIDACSDLLTQFGGHNFAAGMTLPIENVAAFRDKFEEVVSNSITDDMLIPKIEVDAEIHLDSITKRFFNVIQRMAPFGPQNRQPVFISTKVQLVNPPRLLKEKHLKLRIKQGKYSFDCIGFNMPDYYAKLEAQEPFDICYNIDENHYNGKTTLQLRIKDLRFGE
jgi:single-stranded-DNA-specific exonuclease